MKINQDAKSQLTFINSANLNNTKIIAGSMRTLEQLKWTFQYGTVPTIGERVWPLLFENNELKSLIELDYNIEMNDIIFSPLVKEKGINLSISFFNQMDECGKLAYENFKNK